MQTVEDLNRDISEAETRLSALRKDLDVRNSIRRAIVQANLKRYAHEAQALESSGRNIFLQSAALMTADIAQSLKDLSVRSRNK